MPASHATPFVVIRAIWPLSLTRGNVTMQNQASIAATPRAAVVSTVIAKPLQIAGAFLLGVVIMYGAAFVQTSAVHNAAHDMRHSQGFPCH